MALDGLVRKDPSHAMIDFVGGEPRSLEYSIRQVWFASAPGKQPDRDRLIAMVKERHHIESGRNGQLQVSGGLGKETAEHQSAELFIRLVQVSALSFSRTGRFTADLVVPAFWTSMGTGFRK